MTMTVVSNEVWRSRGCAVTAARLENRLPTIELLLSGYQDRNEPVGG
jgi:hypothetical protein